MGWKIKNNGNTILLYKCAMKSCFHCYLGCIKNKATKIWFRCIMHNEIIFPLHKQEVKNLIQWKYDSIVHCTTIKSYFSCWFNINDSNHHPKQQHWFNNNNNKDPTTKPATKGRARGTQILIVWGNGCVDLDDHRQGGRGWSLAVVGELEWVACSCWRMRMRSHHDGEDWRWGRTWWQWTGVGG